MFRKPTGDLDWEAPTDEKLLKEEMLYGQIRDLLAPFVLPLAKQRYAELTINGFDVDEETKEKLREIVSSEAFLALQQQATKTTAISAEEPEVEYALDELTRFWIDVLLVRQIRCETTLCITSLDDSMLPTDEPLLKEAFLSLTSAICLTPADIRSVLRSLKQSLPTDKVLPDCMIELLEMENITLA